MVKSGDVFNPFPGLRPFAYSDRGFFFGRDIPVSQITEKLNNNGIVTIIGTSGSGKSSLINAGIIPAMLKNGIDGGDTQCRVVSLKPGNAPFDNLSRALIASGKDRNSNSDKGEQPEEISRILRNNVNGLADALSRTKTGGKEKVLLVIDQFEDLFRYRYSRNNSILIHEHDSFIRLLVEARSQTTIPVYIIVSIQSDFIGDFQHFHEFGSLINESSYILPQMTRDDIKEAIHRPAALAGIDIDPRLEAHLFNELRNRTDSLPLLQHLLNRMFEFRKSHDNFDQPISFEDYEGVGTIDNAVSRHADEAFMSLSDNGRLVCEHMFKVLTEKGVDNREFANPSRVADIASIIRVRVADVIEIADKFRQPDHLFLQPGNDVRLNSDTVIDLAHESLIRLWRRLRGWAEEEADSVVMYKHLAEASRFYQMGKGPLLTTPELQLALNWYEKNDPSFQWAQRYNRAFERTVQFLRKSKEVHDLREEEKQEQSIKLRSSLRMVAAIGLLIVAGAGYLIFNLSGSLSRMRAELDAVEAVENDASGRIAIIDTMAGNAVDQDNEVPVRSGVAPDRQEPAQPVRRARTADEAPAEAEESPPALLSGLDLPESRVEPAPAISAEEIRAREEAQKRRMLAISQSLAVRALQVENDPDLKALLALQSHVFNEQYNGAGYNPEIYAGLISSVSELYGNSFNVFRGHSESVNSVVFRRNSSIFYTAASDGQVLQWDLNDRNGQPRTLAQLPFVNNKIVISPNGQWLAVGTNGGGIQIINPTRSLTTPFQISYGDNRIIALDFLPDNEHIVFAGSDNSLIRYHIRTNTREIIAEIGSEVLSLAVSAGGNLIVAGTRAGHVYLLNRGSGYVPELIQSSDGNDIHAVSFNSDGSRIAAGNLRGEISIIDVATRTLITTLRGHSARVVDLDFTPDNSLLASSSFDGTIHVWNLQNPGESPLVLRGHGSWVRSVAFNSSGDKLVSGSRQEDRLRAWIFNTNEISTLICDRLSRSMTQTEWNRFVGEDIPYAEPCR